MNVEDSLDASEIKSIQFLIEALDYSSEKDYKKLEEFIQNKMAMFKKNNHPYKLYFKAMLLRCTNESNYHEYEENYYGLLSKSAKRGCKEAQYIIANQCYEKKQYQEAIELYKESSFNGYAPAQWCYGIDLFNGIKDVLEKDEEKGLLYIEFSAGQSYEYALEFLINRYRTIKEKKEEDMIRLDMYINMLKITEQ